MADGSNTSQRLRGRAVEDAALAWVMGYEIAHGRSPVDRRYVRGFSGDVHSPPRTIELKSSATSFRGWFLPLEPIQFQHAGSDEDFYIYIVENVGQGDPAAFTLRVLDPEHLARLKERFAERHYYEVSWPTADYDVTPVESLAGQADERTVPLVQAQAHEGGLRSDVSRAVETALIDLGGEGSLAEISAAVEALQPGRWKDLQTAIADMTSPGSRSSQVPADQRIIERVGRGRYRLKRRPS